MQTNPNHSIQPSSASNCHNSFWPFGTSLECLCDTNIELNSSPGDTVSQRRRVAFEFWVLPISTPGHTPYFLSWFLFLFSSPSAIPASRELILSANVADGGKGSLVFQERDVRCATLRKNVNLIRKASRSGRAFVTLPLPPLRLPPSTIFFPFLVNFEFYFWFLRNCVTLYGSCLAQNRSLRKNI